MINAFDNKKFKLRYIDNIDNKKAVVTHFLHDFQNDIENYFTEEAFQYLDEIIEFKNETDNLNLNRNDVLQQIQENIINVPFPTPDNYDFTFIDLFAGIGGFRLALQNNGGRCVFSSEWDKFAQITYKENFGEFPFGDISKEITKSYIPEQFDVLCGGFPCQPFSNAGLKRGFEDTRGTLFFDVADILNRRVEAGNPVSVVFLENVKGLRGHDKGNTLSRIIRTLEELGYSVATQVLNSKNFGIPQNRERLFIVAWRTNLNLTFNFPLGIDQDNNLIFDANELNNVTNTNVGQILSENPDSKYTISDRLYAGHIRRRKEHKEKGNGFGFSSVNENTQYTSTISARYYKDGSEILIEQEDANPRKLTPREAAKLQGYPENFIIPVSDNQAYKQFGNSVSVPVIQTIFQEINNQLL